MSHAHPAIAVARLLLLLLLLASTPARAQSVPYGLVLWWPMKEVGGATLYDKSPIGMPGYLTNGVTRILSPGGPALRFDGVDDYVSAAGSSPVYVFADTSFTVVVRMKVPSGAAQGYLFARRDSSASIAGWFARTETDGTLSVRIMGFAGGFARDKRTTGVYADSTWHHLAVVYTTDTTTQPGNTLTTYIDGKAVAMTDNGGDQAYGATTLPVTLGAPANLGSWLTGSLGDFRIYNRALSATDILQLAQASTMAAVPNPLDLLLKAMVPPPPVRHRSTLY